MAPVARIQAHHVTLGQRYDATCETPSTSCHFRPKTWHHLRDYKHIMSLQAKYMAPVARIQAHHGTSGQRHDATCETLSTSCHFRPNTWYHLRDSGTSCHFRPKTWYHLRDSMNIMTL
ncbi:hypothetical protein ACJMK2_031543 [Sinanodonta woodiana]|uniref:Uncharacterized protein n=1 Tax=Sinanodonta woodiana TaxID=1069815 RepID=A0ABD3WZN1_SINWO